MANETPASEGWRIVSVIVGWIYFSAWTVSFWPQIWVNFRRKRTDGLSYTFALLNTFGFLSLSIYTILKFAAQIKYDMVWAVQVQDVCFAVHAFLACVAVLVQIGLYDERPWHVKYNKWLRYALYLLILVSLIQIILTAAGVQGTSNNEFTPKSDEKFSAWTLAEYFSAVKITITLLKYVPQVVLNFRNKSTHGVSIWNWNLDVTGGVLSIAQNIIDYLNYDDISFVTDNIPKYIISCLSLVYDAILLIQHYWLFHHNTKKQAEEERLGINEPHKIDSDREYTASRELSVAEAV